MKRLLLEPNNEIVVATKSRSFARRLEKVSTCEGVLVRQVNFFLLKCKEKPENKQWNLEKFRKRKSSTLCLPKHITLVKLMLLRRIPLRSFFSLQSEFQSFF